MNWLELIAVIFGLACVYLTTRQSLWCWPMGLVQVSLYVVIFAEQRLYSDVILHLIYVVLQFYGWFHWKRGDGRHQAIPVSRLGLRAGLVWLAVAVLASLSLGEAMARFTDASLPYWDAVIAVLSLIAQYFMARKILEHWLIWIVVDVIAIGVYASKHLYLTTGLYAVFLILSIFGFVTWKQSERVDAKTA